MLLKSTLLWLSGQLRCARLHRGGLSLKMQPETRWYRSETYYIALDCMLQACLALTGLWVVGHDSIQLLFMYRSTQVCTSPHAWLSWHKTLHTALPAC
jgi:hypothetical protein